MTDAELALLYEANQRTARSMGVDLKVMDLTGPAFFLDGKLVGTDLSDVADAIEEERDRRAAGLELRELRESRDVTRKQLARALDVSVAELVDVELGQAPVPVWLGLAAGMLGPGVHGGNFGHDRPPRRCRVRDHDGSLCVRPIAHFNGHSYQKGPGTWDAEGERADPIPEAQPLDPIGVLVLPVRADVALRRSGIHTLGDLTALTWGGVLRLQNINRRCLRHIEDGLRRVGLQLAQECDQ